MKSFDKLKAKLTELFQLDQADLDFGIYRIMNLRREEIVRFLEHDLLPQVREAFKEYRSADKTALKEELDKAIDNAESLGVDLASVPKVKELQAKYETTAVDVLALENEVYDHLYSFFSRYYDEGDFISLRRYKEGVYAIPYEGEEVKLHWANHDQYYIKTTEYFSDYTFKTPSGQRVHFKIVEADTEKDNVKTTNGKDRRFFLHHEKPVTEDQSELVIRFEFRPDEEKRKQDAINAATTRRIFENLNNEKLAVWQQRLSVKWKRTDGTTSDRSVLERHLYDYTRRNTFDYFIHKDLGGFLRRELDFYIKNEVMRLDDIEQESVPRAEQYLSKIKVIRRIAHKIIHFLAQIEDFQKRLWLKKKFVVETNYFMTLDRIPEDLYPEIVSNDAQREEWIRLFAINDLEGFTEAINVEFLRQNPYLVLDTALFEEDFKARLLKAIEDLDEQCDGVLIHSENFQALNLIDRRYLESVDCIYIDPPYNTGGSGFLYKDSYSHSSWLCMSHNRLRLSKELLSKHGIFFSNMDESENFNYGNILDEVFGAAMKQGEIAWKNKYGPGALTRGFGSIHEYIFAYTKEPATSIETELPDEEKAKYKNRDSKYEIRGGYITQPLMTKSKDDRPNLVYPIVWQGKGIWPDKQWIWSKDRLEAALNNDEVVIRENAGTFSVRFKQYLRDEQGVVRKGKPLTFMIGPFNQDGTKEVDNLFGFRAFDFPKPTRLVGHFVNISVNGSNPGQATILDHFAGSGTTGHAVINLNREDGGKRRYILVEMGDYFDTVLRPRIKKVIYSKDWNKGKPVARDGISHICKCIRLESYEDALANIQLQRTEEQQSLLDKAEGFHESYMLGYMLGTESECSQTLLNIDNLGACPKMQG